MCFTVFSVFSSVFCVNRTRFHKGFITALAIILYYACRVKVINPRRACARGLYLVCKCVCARAVDSPGSQSPGPPGPGDVIILSILARAPRA